MRALAVLPLLLVLPAQADVVASAPGHYELAHSATSELSPDEMWARLLDVPAWWQDAHTYSGSAANLSLDARAGGLWREDWEGGSVAHGTVLLVQPPTADAPGTLRVDAPFGPLQERDVRVVWTITVAPHADGSEVTFRELASGPERSGLDTLAPAVDFVKGEALKSLVDKGVP